MQKAPDYIVCNNCDTPCYVFEMDHGGRLESAYCQACGNDDVTEFRTPEEEEEASGA